MAMLMDFLKQMRDIPLFLGSGVFAIHASSTESKACHLIGSMPDTIV
jgi:hypothetical protein